MRRTLYVIVVLCSLFLCAPAAAQSGKLSVPKKAKPATATSPKKTTKIVPHSALPERIQHLDEEPGKPARIQHWDDELEKPARIQHWDEELEIEEDLTQTEEPIFQVVEHDPEFPGGVEAMYRYLNENISYPRLARENNITGRVFVTFVVERDGSISNVKVLRDIGGGCGQEAVRVVKSMPRWVPGSQRGTPVRVQYNLPINFTLRDKD